MILVSSTEAKRNGSFRYFTGKLCRRGHICERVVANRACIDCLAIASKKCRDINLEAWHKKEALNRESRRKESLDYSRNRYKTDKAKVRAATDKYRLNNKHKDAAKTSRRKAAKLKACPSWVDLKEIEIFYKNARDLTLETGIPHEVDHIHPLRGSNFCGLHVPWNLQILTKSENCSKGNKLMIEAALKE